VARHHRVRGGGGEDVRDAEANGAAAVAGGGRAPLRGGNGKEVHRQGGSECPNAHGDESDADANRGGCGKGEEGAATGGSMGVGGSCTFAAGVVDVSSWARAEVDHVSGTDGGHGRSPQRRNELQRKEERRTWESGGGERTAWGSGTIEALRERSVFDGD